MPDGGYGHRSIPCSLTPRSTSRSCNGRRLSHNTDVRAANYTYNSSTGLPQRVTYPTSTASYRLALEYGYQYGLLEKVMDANSDTVFWQADATDARGAVTQATLGNGVVVSRAVDAVTGQINSLQAGVGSGAALQNESYLFDRVGNVVQRQQNNLGLSENFYYDALDRLDYSTRAGSRTLI